jgi:hypothetical protein
MKRSFQLGCCLSIGLLVFLPLLSSGISIAFNSYFVGGKLACTPDADNYTKIPIQTSSLSVVRLVTESGVNTVAYNFNDYANNQMPAEWGGNTITGSQGIVASTKVRKSLTPIVWDTMGSTEYANNAPGVSSNLQFTHNSYNDNDNSLSGKHATASRFLPNSTIGELSFNIMPHLVYSASAPRRPDGSEGIFYVELMQQKDSAPAIQLIFKTRPGVGTDRYIGVYAQSIDPISGFKNATTSLFNGTTNNFNWLRVSLFFDTYNDVYNITIGQYAMDFQGYLVEPQSTILRGQQRNSELTRLSNVGTRYAAGHEVNLIKLRLESYAIDKVSNTYFDRLNLKTFQFPAVYADTTLRNTSISANPTTASGISLMNNSIITAYEPPRYPNATDAIGIDAPYLSSPLNPGKLTPWIMAPAWCYAFPLFVTADKNLNAQSILALIQNSEQTIETRGINQPAPNSDYFLSPELRLSALDFAYDASKSGEYRYFYRSQTSQKVIVVEYEDKINTAGVLKSVGLYSTEALTTKLYYMSTAYTAVPFDEPPPNWLWVLIPVGILAGVGLVIFFKKRFMD